MYQLAKDLAKEFDGDIMVKNDIIDEYVLAGYSEVITLLYPMHIYGQLSRKIDTKWICYDQKIPSITKTYFPNFWRRQAMRYINWRNNATMQGADEYWDVTEREQKPRWTKKSRTKVFINGGEKYSIFLGRISDYKNFYWLQKIMNELGIRLEHPQNTEDEEIYIMLSNAKMLVTASIWEGFGRPVMEAETLGIPAVAYDVGAHKRYIKKGICVHLDINNMQKSEEDFKKAVLKVWNR